MKLSKNLCFRLSKEQLVRITEKSEELGMPKSTFCRMAVLTFMKGKIDEKEEVSS
jgi:predicted DNA-binding protein